jgi:hypothetical protein
MNLSRIVRELYASEARLLDRLHDLIERHAAEPEIRHVAVDLVTWSERHLEALRDHQERAASTASPLRRIGEKLGAGRDPDPRLALLDDLKALYLAAAEVSVNWELLGQGAQAVSNTDLLALTSRCHPETLRQLRWANGMLKTLAPQILASH